MSRADLVLTRSEALGWLTGMLLMCWSEYQHRPWNRLRSLGGCLKCVLWILLLPAECWALGLRQLFDEFAIKVHRGQLPSPPPWIRRMMGLPQGAVSDDATNPHHGGT